MNCTVLSGQNVTFFRIPPRKKTSEHGTVTYVSEYIHEQGDA